MGLTESCRDCGRKDTVLVNRGRGRESPFKVQGLKANSGPFKWLQPFNRCAHIRPQPVQIVQNVQSLRYVQGLTPGSKFQVQSSRSDSNGKLHVLRILKMSK